MKIDFADIFRIIMLYLEHKKKIEEVIRIVDKEQNPAKPPETPPVLVPSQNQVVFSLVAKCYYLEGDRKGGSGGPIYSKQHFDQVLSPNASVAQMAGERMHFDAVAFDQFNNEIPAEKLPGNVGTKQDNQKQMDFKWTYAGKVNTNSAEEPDRFALESSWDDYGMTPVLLLETVSPGRWPCTFQYRLKAEHNGGVEVLSNIVTWYAD